MTLKRGIHVGELDELHRRRRGSKFAYSGIVTRKPATAPASAIQRAKLGVAVAADDEHGDAGDDRHPDRERRGYGIIACCPRSTQPTRVRSAEDADDHRERVVIDVAGLDAPQHAARPADEPAPSR